MPHGGNAVRTIFTRQDERVGEELADAEDETWSNKMAVHSEEVTDKREKGHPETNSMHRLLRIPCS